MRVLDYPDEGQRGCTEKRLQEAIAAPPYCGSTAAVPKWLTRIGKFGVCQGSGTTGRTRLRLAAGSGLGEAGNLESRDRGCAGFDADPLAFADVVDLAVLRLIAANPVIARVCRKL